MVIVDRPGRWPAGPADDGPAGPAGGAWPACLLPAAVPAACCCRACRALLPRVLRDD